MSSASTSRMGLGQLGWSLDQADPGFPARGQRISSAQGPRWKLPEVVYDGFWQKWSKGCRFPASTCPLSPAAVTGLMFLQVPPYPEVFRDSVHTYKLNEQDTDVRAALLLPLSTPPLLLLFSSSSSSIHLSPRGSSHMRLMFSLTAKTTFFLSLLTPLLFSFFPLPLPPTLPVCFPLSPRPRVSSSGICFLQELRLC